MASFMDFLSRPALQQAMADTRALQHERALAVQPKPALEALTKDALASAHASRTAALGEQQLALGEKTLGLQERKLRAEEKEAAFQSRLEPFAMLAGAAGVGTQILGGIRGLDAQKRWETLMQANNQRAQAGLAQEAQRTAAYRQTLADVVAEYRKQLAPPTTAAPYVQTPGYGE